MASRNKDRTIAALATTSVVAAILALLFCGSISWDRQLIAQDPSPEIEPEETFYEPELVELGEETSVAKDKPAPTLKGKPKPDKTDNAEIVDPGLKETPKPKPARNENTLKKESKLQQEEAARTEKERKLATSSVASKFSPKNGAEEGSDKGVSGSGQEGVGINGNAHGRTFISCPKPDVALRHKTVVTVNVVIDADGNVSDANASGSADASIRRKCEAAARRAKWSPKKGVASTRGSITFVIYPK